MLLPNPEDFIRTDKRPACPICGLTMIHAEIRTKPLSQFHVWICTCESQPVGVVEELIICRESDDPSESMVFDEQ